MKKNLRLLCLGLAAASFMTSFAQEDVTSKLINADMEKGVIGWNLKFDSHIWKKNTKNQATRPGFHGVNNVVLENWKGDATTGLSDNTISQTIKDLPNGTYVFGAYIGASVQTQEENKESVTGVTLFANEASVPVATNNPDVNQKWAHTAKFNVAVNVIDGTLNVGLKAEATNANYLVWDNATLYFFGNMDAAAALDEMAKIDMAATVAIADTCVAYKMHVDTAAYLNEQIAAGKALVSAAEAYNTDENVYWAIRLANKSIADYRSFNNAIVAAEEVAAGEWNASVAEYVDALNALIVDAKATYEAAATARPELNAKKTALNEAAALVSLDSCYDVMDGLNDYVQALVPSDELGEYSEDMINQLYDLLGEVDFALEAAYAGEESAVRTHDIYDSLYVAIQDILANPNSVDEFPFTVGEADGTVATKVDGRFEFTSKTYNMAFPVTNLRFTFLESYNENGAACLDSGKYPQIAIGEFYVYDGEGNPIDLEEANFSTNAQETSEGPMVNICDGEKGTFWHSSWSASVGTYHYLEVALPEGLDLTSFSFGWVSRYTAQVVPKTVEVSSISSADADLESAIYSALSMNAYQGTAPGFYNADLSAFYAAIEAAEQLQVNGGTDEEIYAAIAALETEQGKLDEMGIVMPEPGKKYRIVSAVPFFEKQGLHKAWTAYSDTTLVNQVWWETAHPDSLDQLFTFEVLPNEEGRNYYVVKNVATDLYVSTALDDEGDELNAVGLFATSDTIELQALGYGQFGLVNSGMIHAGSHNSGAYSESAGAYGGIAGVYSSMVKWNTGAYNASAWYIREMQELPYAAKSISDLNFVSESINLYSGVNTLTLTADKDCAFADLKVYDLLGAEIPTTVAQAGATATVVLDTTVVDAFSFVFTNAEGVATVTVDGVISKLSILQEAYDAAVAALPESTRGTEIGQVSNTAEYDAAIAAAEALLQNGGTDEAIQQAANDLDSAVVHLEINLPLPDKTYFILSGHSAFFDNHGVDIALYAKEDAPAWSYVGLSDPAYLWKFEETEPMNGDRVFYLKNVGTEMYMGSSDAFSTPLTMVAEPAATQPFRIDMQEGVIVTICDGRYSNGNLHMNGHGGGANAFGNVVYWSSTVGTASAMKIAESEKYIADLMANIEDVEFVDEYVAPAKKGIYDLFGRRIEAPAATGIYIVDGKKRVIKK